MIKINNLKLGLDEPIEALRQQIADCLKIHEDTFSWKIVRESLDARRREKPHFIYQVEVQAEIDEHQVKRLRNKDILWVKDEANDVVAIGNQTLSERPIVIGAGPAGLFCTYELARLGYHPILLEQGGILKDRIADVETFWKEGILNPQSNVQFGEGGAGTFSDGKLTSRSKNPLGKMVLDTFVAYGAPEEIAYQQRPHIGTDRLRHVLIHMRKAIQEQGGEIRFQTQVQSIWHQGKIVKGVILSDGTTIAAEVVVAALGHSARNLFEQFYADGIAMEGKAFAVGCRIEHPQQMIDTHQFRDYTGHPRLGHASYQLTSQDVLSGRGVYTFCMCPGGYVVGASSEENRLVVNGMSYYARDGCNANSALLVSVSPNDFGKHPLDGIAFQRHLEEKAFHLGGGGYVAPVQRVDDFLRGRGSQPLGDIKPTVQPGYIQADLSSIFPQQIHQAMSRGLQNMGKLFKYFDRPDAVLTAVESRSSSPVRILRNVETLESISHAGLYPCGEGAGYAGGIVSSGIDGLRVAREIARKYRPA